MSRRVASGLAIFLFLGWIANLVTLSRHGSNRELYPLTAFPMFAGTSGKPSRDVVEHRLLVEVDPGGDLREVSATEMVARGMSSTRSRTRKILGRLAESLDGAGETATERGRAVPADLAALWLANARDLLGLARPPHAVHLVRHVIPFDQSFEALRSRRGTTETIAIVTAAEASR